MARRGGGGRVGVHECDKISLNKLCTNSTRALKKHLRCSLGPFSSRFSSMKIFPLIKFECRIQTIDKIIKGVIKGQGGSCPPPRGHIFPKNGYFRGETEFGPTP